MAIVYFRDNIWVRVEGLSDVQEAALDRMISTPKKGIWFSPKMRALIKSGAMDDKEHLYDRLRRRFPAGLLDLVQDKMGGTIVEAKIGFRPESRFPTPTCLKGVTLQDWQIEAPQETLLDERGIWKMATGSGKTECGAALCWCFPKATVLWLVHTKDLLLQTRDRLQLRLGEKIGVLGAGQMEEGRIIVATVQTIEYRKKAWRQLLAGFQILIMDEAHHLAAQGWSGIARWCTSARIRIAMSGTPFDRDDEGRTLKLMGATGSKILCEVTTKQLVKIGWLAQPVVHLYKHVGKENGLPYLQAYRQQLLDPSYNRSVAKEVASYAQNGYHCLVLVSQIHHGLNLRDLLAGHEVPATFVSGRDKADWRKAKLDQMRSRQASVLIATSLFDEGVDIPAINCVALAGLGRKERQLLQRIGRGLRKKEGDNVAHILDWEPHTNAYLLEHALERQEIYREQDYRVMEGSTGWSDFIKESRGI